MWTRPERRASSLYRPPCCHRLLDNLQHIVFLPAVTVCRATTFMRFRGFLKRSAFSSISSCFRLRMGAVTDGHSTSGIPRVAASEHSLQNS